MKFLHMADMHFDAPFSSLNSKKNLGETRRLEQRNVFKEIITGYNLSNSVVDDNYSTYYKTVQKDSIQYTNIIKSKLIDKKFSI